MIYIAAMLFGVATWMANPIASGVMVFFGVIVTGVWVRDFFVQMATNQTKMVKYLDRR